MYYLAYGSNLHPLRLALRVPGSRLAGTVRLAGWRLVFNKRSLDGSSKCSLDFSGDPGHVTHAAVYEVPADEVHLLDAVEGLGAGYWKQEISVDLGDGPLPVFLYLASATHVVEDLEPYHWYKELVLAGGRRHGFPAAYLQQIAAVASKPDREHARRTEMERLLARCEG